MNAEDAARLEHALRGAPTGDTALAIAEGVRRAGGRAVLVGGWVRDALLGRESKDLDLEVSGLALPELERLLASHGEVIRVGRAFGVLRVKGADLDVSLPRRDSKTGPGHRGFEVDFDPALPFAEASRRRDLTVNALGYDPLAGVLLDEHGGRGDLEQRVLRATDPAHFPEDPLRGLRVAQLLARLGFRADPELVALSSALDLSELAPERVFEELRKLSLKGVRPSLGLHFLRETRLLRFLPELDALVGVPQDPRWHPEGDVFTHTGLVADAAAALRTGDAVDDARLGFAALAHDLGKPGATRRDGERIRAHGHEVLGATVARQWLESLRAPIALVDAVEALVRWHLAPVQLVAEGARPRAYRRLARELARADVSLALLERVTRADQLGRTTEDALAGRFEAGEQFLRAASEAAVRHAAPRDAVQGRHLVARGLEPGPRFADILAACRELQDETGATDAEAILEQVLGAEG